LMREQVYIPVVISDLKKSLIQPPERYNLFPSVTDVQNFQYKKVCIDLECNRYTQEISVVGIERRPF
jgi:hypothetical protein